MRIKKKAKRKASQLWRSCVVDGMLDQDRVRQAVQHVATAGYRDYPAVLEQLRRLVKLDFARHTATIESAARLPDDLQAAVRDNLMRLYGAGLTTVFVERPSLIGGMRIQVGSDLYDGSLLAELKALEKSF